MRDATTGEVWTGHFYRHSTDSTLMWVAVHTHLVRDSGPLEYDDGKISCTASGLVIRMYYPWGSKKIAYGAIRTVRRRGLGTWSGQLRIWGSGDFKHWLNFDASRMKKTQALEIDLGRRVVPVITPDDTDRVVEVLRSHGVEVVDA